jgi:hypothetical protein
MKKDSKNKLENAQVRIVNGKRVIVLPCEEPEYTPKKKRTGKGKIAKMFKNRG